MYCKIEKLVKQGNQHKVVIAVYGDAPKLKLEELNIDDTSDKELKAAIKLVVDKMQGAMGTELSIRDDFMTEFEKLEVEKDDGEPEKSTGAEGPSQ